jgi:hypothetical protein
LNVFHFLTSRLSNDRVSVANSKNTAIFWVIAKNFISKQA